GGGQVRPELLHVRVHRLVDRGGAAAVVHHVRRGDGQLGYGRGDVGPQERERVREDRVVDLELAVDADRGGGELDVPRGVVELHRQVARRLGHPAEGVDEVHVPGGPAELPVGGRLQADLLLHLDRAGDLKVLHRAQVRRRDPSGREVLTRLQQALRTEQAADVVGAERGARPGGHGYLVLLRCRGNAERVGRIPRMTFGIRSSPVVVFISRASRRRKCHISQAAQYRPAKVILIGWAAPYRLS